MNEVKSKYTLEGTEIDGHRILADNNHSQKKHHCPSCGKRRFVRFVNIKTGEYCPERFGRCDREENCGHYLHPSEEGFQIESSDQSKWVNGKEVNTSRPSVIPKDKAKQTVYPEGNKLYQFLAGIFDQESVKKAFREYGIGTDSVKWQGAPIFYQIDLKNRIRGGKIIDYKPDGHRVKSRANWVHSLWKLQDFNMQQVLFGLHLLNKYPDKTVCVVEAEKTALIASIVWQDYLWLATGGLTNKPYDKCKALVGKRVILIPDVGATDKWQAVAKELNQLEGGDFRVFDFLESKAAGEFEGFDLADFIIKNESLLHASGLEFLLNQKEPEAKNIDHDRYFREWELMNAGN